MMENRISRRKIYRNLFALIILSVGALLIMQPRKATAFNCDNNYTNALSNCLVDNEWFNGGNYILGWYVTPAQYYACAKTSQTSNASCLSDDGYEAACDNIFNSCGYLDGSAVGDCYSSYASCEFGHMSTHYAMLQCVVQDTSPCREAAWADFWACQSNPGDFGCPEGTDCCLGLERAALANCTSCD